MFRRLVLIQLLLTTVTVNCRPANPDNIKDNLDQMSDALDKLKSSGVLEGLLGENQDGAEIGNEIDDDIKLIQDMRKKYGNNQSDQILYH